MGSTFLGFHLTDRCQLDCKHCARDPAKMPTDLEPATFEKIVREARATYGISHVALTGGEPTLHPRFAELIDVVAGHGMSWHLVTNGGTFPKLVETLWAKSRRRESLAYVAISLDGATEGTHDRIRGIGSYRQVMTALSLCTAHGIRFQLKMTVHARNVDEVDALGLLASQLGASELSFSVFQPTGTLHDVDLFLPAREWRALRERVERLATVLTMPVVLADGFPERAAFYACGPFRGEQLHVDVYGRLSLCCAHADQPSEGRDDEIAGDLHTMSLVDAHRKLIGIVRSAQDAKLEAMAAGAIGEWDRMPCNFCMKHFGKPHWTTEGAAGPSAKRERWRGAWSIDKQIARNQDDENADSSGKLRLRVVR
jgi:MoaA/NifB/PqqE/SkfB family radical SAM enzyme